MKGSWGAATSPFTESNDVVVDRSADEFRYTLGDDAGAKKFQIENNSEVDMFIVDSLGNVTVSGDTIYRGDQEIYEAGTLASESLDQGNFDSHSSWDVVGDFDDTGGAAVYTDSTNSGTLTQTSANMAIAGIVGGRWYRFEYDIVTPSGDVAFQITTAFAATAQSLSMTAGTNKTLDFKAKATPGDFVISGTSTSGAATLDNVSLKEIIGGDLQVHGDLEVGGTIRLGESGGGPLLKATLADYLYIRTDDDAGNGNMVCDTAFINYPRIIRISPISAADMVSRLSGANAFTFETTGSVEFFSIESTGELISTEPNYGGGFSQKWYTAEATLSGASTVCQVNVPSGAKLLWAWWIVKTAITGTGASTWDASFSGGSAAAICTTQAFAQNTKGNIAFNENAATAIASSEVDITITPDAGTFDTGVVVCMVLAQVATDMDSF
jgi:hypothetical protein